MSSWVAERRRQFEKGVQAEPDGCFLVRPFGMFGAVYALQNATTKKHYISERIKLDFICIIVILALFFAYFLAIVFAPAYLNFLHYIPREYRAIVLYVLCFCLFIVLKAIFIRRILRSTGGHPVSCARWHGTEEENPFTAVESRQLGGTFILLVSITALLSFVLAASYFGPYGDDGSMPYMLVMLILTICASLAVAFWRELRRRERRRHTE